MLIGGLLGFDVLSLLPLLPRIFRLLSLEEQDSAVAKVEVDEVLCFCSSTISDFARLLALSQRLTVGHEATEVSSYDAVPCSPFPVIELFVSLVLASLRHPPMIAVLFA